MSYRAGMGPGLAKALGIDEPGPGGHIPRIICDGCGTFRPVEKRNGQPYAWFLNRKNVPGWSLDRSADGFTRHDLCKDCRER